MGVFSAVSLVWNLSSPVNTEWIWGDTIITWLYSSAIVMENFAVPSFLNVFISCCMISVCRSFQTSRSFIATCWVFWETWLRSKLCGHSCSPHSSSQCSGTRGRNTWTETLLVITIGPHSLSSQPLHVLFSVCFLCSNLLDSKADGIEVSYNACGVLSHIMFDGPEVWKMEEPRRDMVMEKMWEAIQSWDVSSRRNINYRWSITFSPLQWTSTAAGGLSCLNVLTKRRSSPRSFEPILRLLPQSISPVSQHWATWALYNLVSVYREYQEALRAQRVSFTPKAVLKGLYVTWLA